MSDMQECNDQVRNLTTVSGYPSTSADRDVIQPAPASRLQQVLNLFTIIKQCTKFMYTYRAIGWQKRADEFSDPTLQ